ncbi:MAG: LPS export ABC transporter periplasmic protein LptC [Acidobacteria bacterium]|nr:LPS export ABC transporter periplasmic protein LptC [Acidobacteriota bacterium]
MPVSIPHLRRWFAWAAAAVALAVAAAYFYAHLADVAAGHNIPEKMGLEIQQTANGFTVSKSEQGRTIFTIHAGNAVQYRQGGQAVLHNVAISIYGKQHDRFDQIYGSEFIYDQQTGIVTGRGEVQIDLESNPQGVLQPDQTTPRELKNPVHLRTSGLVFNQKTGDAYTTERVDFSVQQATGSALGATYKAKEGTLDMHSQVHVVLTGSSAGILDATHGIIHREPKTVDLNDPHLVHGPESYQSDYGTIFLRQDNSLERMVGTGHVKIHMDGDSPIDARSDRADLFMVPEGSPTDAKFGMVAARHNTSARQISSPAARQTKGAEPPPPASLSQASSLAQPSPRNLLRLAILTGNVHGENQGRQPMEGDCGRALFHFTGRNILTTARAEQNVRIIEHHVGGNKPDQPLSSAAGQKPSDRSMPEDIIVNAPIVDFFVGNQGKSLNSAVTSGPPKITIVPSDGARGQITVITAQKFFAQFDDQSRLKSVHGAADARILNAAPGEPDRISTSDALDAAFQPSGGIESIVETGRVTYVDAGRKAWGDRALYTPRDQMLYLHGSPRFVQGGMTTTAREMRMDRDKGDAWAEGDVKSTYSDLKEQPNGALLSSSDPIHITAINMVSHRNPGLATYTGNARLWQTNSVVQAPIIVFDRDARSVLADGTPDYRVSTVFTQSDSNRKQTPVHIVSDHLTYFDNERRAHFSGRVVSKSEDATLTSDDSDVFWLPRESPTDSTPPLSSNPQSGLRVSTQGVGPPSASGALNANLTAGTDKIDKIVADGHVVITQPKRRGLGTHLVYTASDDRFVLTGGSPSIFDAERGQVTGDSLTFYKRDDRVLVEGKANSPAFSETRVAR